MRFRRGTQNPAYGAGEARRRRTSAASAGGTRSSASTNSTQRPVARSSAWLRWRWKLSKRRRTTRAPAPAAIWPVSFLDRSSSTTSSSSAEATLARQPPIRWASSRANTTADSDGTGSTLVADLDPGAADPVILERDPLVDQAAVEEEAVGRRPDHPIEVRAVVDADLADDGRLGAWRQVAAQARAVRIFRAAGGRRSGPVSPQPPDADPVDELLVGDGAEALEAAVGETGLRPAGAQRHRADIPHDRFDLERIADHQPLWRECQAENARIRPA